MPTKKITAPKTNVTKGFFIVVMDKGFVYVGSFEQTSNPAWFKLINSRNIRRYGTTKGIGELALGGPTKETVLDETGDILVPLHSVCHLIFTDEKNWKR